MCWSSRRQLDLAQDVCRLGAELFGEESLCRVTHDLTEASFGESGNWRARELGARLDRELASSESSQLRMLCPTCIHTLPGRAWLCLQPSRWSLLGDSPHRLLPFV